MRFGTFLVATFLILAGVTMFMLNLGYGSWQMVVEAGKFWPILLILLGISLLWGGRIPGWLALLLVVALAGGVVFLFLNTPGMLAESYDNEVTIRRQQHPGLTSGSIDITFGGGQLNLGTDTSEWLAAKFGSRGASSQVEIRDGNLEATFKNPRSSWNLGHAFDNNWNIHLAPDLVWDVQLSAGALEGQLNLTDVPVKNIDLKLGAGDVNLTLGGNGEKTRIEADAGAAELTLRVVGDTGVSIEYDGTLSQTNLSELGYSLVNGRYVSPNYDRASSKIDVDLDMAVGEFRLEAASAIPVAV
ncbi:MAG: LiaI-LiaF-like domain-containing protein [Bacillota bacterium]